MMYSALVQDDVFEDSIVDFFETADANKDGVLEYNDFIHCKLTSKSPCAVASFPHVFCSQCLFSLVKPKVHLEIQ